MNDSNFNERDLEILRARQNELIDAEATNFIAYTISNIHAMAVSLLMQSTGLTLSRLRCDKSIEDREQETIALTLLSLIAQTIVACGLKEVFIAGMNVWEEKLRQEQGNERSN
jgi:hypothetical protein